MLAQEDNLQTKAVLVGSIPAVPRPAFPFGRWNWNRDCLGSLAGKRDRRMAPYENNQPGVPCRSVSGRIGSFPGQGIEAMLGSIPLNI